MESHQPLSTQFQREFFESTASFGVALEAMVRGEAVSMTREDIDRMLFAQVHKVHEHTVRLALEVDRLKGVAGE